MITIAIDAGHGLKTPGKQTPDGIKEWTLNDKVADKVVKNLKDYDVKIIRTDNDEGNTDESLTSRLNRYVNAGVSVFVSIHHNAFTGSWNGATGVEVYTDNNPTAKDTQLANLVYEKMVKYTGLKGRGVKKADYTVIDQDRIPAVLCEGGFMDGTNDYKIITSAAGQNAYAKAVSEGLIEFLGLKKKAVEPKPEKKPAAAPVDTSYKVKVNITNLNIRKGPGTNYARTGRFTGKGVFTITETKSGTGSTKGWGKLKSGAGWISLDYTTKI